MGYKKIVDIAFNPGIFRKLPHGTISARLNPESSNAALKSDLLFRQDNEHLSLFGNDNFTFGPSFRNDRKIVIEIFFKSDVIYNYCDLNGMVPGKNLYYFSNCNEPAGAFLSRKEKVTKEDLLTIASSSLVLPASSFGSLKKENISVKDVSGKIIPVPVSNSVSGTALDFSAQAEGKYAIYHQDKLVESAYLLKQFNSPGAVIELALHRLTSKDPVYHITFDTVATYWRYLIVDTKRKYRDFSISSDSDISFVKDGRGHQFADGTQSTFYESTAAIAKDRFPLPKFSLMGIENENKDARELISPLPFPEPGEIPKNHESGKSPKFSEIIVYV